MGTNPRALRSDLPASVAEIEDFCGGNSSGLVDSHVHINDPGRADWEGLDARAAAAGGHLLVDYR
jgi:allantoinase